MVLEQVSLVTNSLLFSWCSLSFEIYFGVVKSQQQELNKK